MNTPDFEAIVEGIKQNIYPRPTEISARFNTASDGELIEVTLGKYTGISNWELRQIEKKILKSQRGKGVPHIGISASERCLGLTLRVKELKKEYIHDCPEQN